MKLFNAVAVRDGKQYSGSFEAASKAEAAEKLKSQKYEILSLQEARSMWPYYLVVGLLAVTTSGAGIWFFYSKKIKPDPAKMADVFDIRPDEKHQKNVQGEWATLRAGHFFIAASHDSFLEAMRYKDAKDEASLDKMLKEERIGLTEDFGAGEEVLVQERNMDRSVQILFEGTGAVAWVEDKALL